MCGISGLLTIEHKKEDIEDKVAKMVAAQRHRGPDDDGVWSYDHEKAKVALGHNRLSIIDLTSDGHQPMTDSNTGNTIVFNGEIYNYKEIRESLIEKGYNFKSKSDTEVILKAYCEWGASCTEHLRGIFAFAIWDVKNQLLFLARDQMGVKPLYYYRGSGSFYFASEVRALLKGGVPANLSREGLNGLLSYGSVQEPYTLINDIFSLEPGYYLIIHEDFHFEKYTYWRPDFSHSVTTEVKEAEAETRRILEESIHLQLVSDVPLGAFLSGGIDSAAIVSLMRKVNPDADIHTFSIVFEDPKYDEREYARLAAKKNRTSHTELLMTGNMIKKSLKAMINAYDQPSMDGMNSWCVSKLVKDNGITVALSGVGGDELFVGYGNFSKSRQIHHYGSKLRKLPDFIGEVIEHLSWNEKIRKIGETVSFDYDDYFMTRRLFSEQQYSDLIEEPYQTNFYQWLHKSYDPITSKQYIDEISMISWYVQRSYMLSTLLRDTDQMSMAHSLEIRVPLIDHKLVEYVTALPMDVKMSMDTPKHLLVKAAREGMPDECIYRRKQGFTFPFDSYIQSELKSELELFFLGDSMPIFRKEGLKQLWQSYQKGKCAWSRILLLFIIDCWMKKNNVAL